MTLPDDLKPATWGVTHGAGFLGDAIRDAELDMSHGDRKASWAGHCVVFIGDHNFGLPQGKVDIRPAIVEAEWPKVVISPADKHPDTIWATGQPLTPNQRKLGVIDVLKLAGTGYDIRAYGYFILKAMQVKIFKNLTPLFTDPKLSICSGIVVKEQIAMGVELDGLPVAAVDNPDFVCPADCLRWGLDNGWMSMPVPEW